MGPDDFISQIEQEDITTFKIENLGKGIQMFCFGLFKEMVLADTFSRAVSWGFSNISSSTVGDFWLVMLFYTFQIHFDFSGYSDMATGVSKMVNIDLPINFDSPYMASTIKDFWRRWHISLTSFLTENIYYPLDGNRKGMVRTCMNIMVVFLISGIWHGANWTFILWGLLHGFIQVIDRLAQKTRKISVNSVSGWILTFFLVNVLWLLFRAINK